MGAKIVAVSDITGALVNEDGFSPQELINYVEKHGDLKKYPGGKKIDRDDLLYLDVDVLIPAALENQIHSRNAEKIKAKMIVEGANAPTTPEGDEILNGKDIYVVPDILANSGGVIVSHLEWVQALSGLYWEEEEVNRHLERKLIKSFEEVWKKSKEFNVSLREASYIVALERIAEVYYYRGIFP